MKVHCVKYVPFVFVCVQVVGAWSQMVIQCSSKPMMNYGSFFIALLRKILTQLHQMLTADP